MKLNAVNDFSNIRPELDIPIWAYVGTKTKHSGQTWDQLTIFMKSLYLGATKQTTVTIYDACEERHSDDVA